MLCEAIMLEGAASEVLIRGGLCPGFPRLTSRKMAVFDYAFNQDKAELFIPI